MVSLRMYGIYCCTVGHKIVPLVYIARCMHTVLDKMESGTSTDFTNEYKMLSYRRETALQGAL